MDIRHEPETHRWVMLLPDGSQAMAQYSLSADGRTMNLYHVFVPPSARGQGVAAKITRAALDYAQSQGWKVIPSCPYAASFIAAHEPYQPLLK